MQAACLDRKLRMEVLEDKRPLAADLTAAIINGDLIINASGGDAGVVVEGIGGGEVRLLATHGGQTINGDPFPSGAYNIPGTLTRDIKVNFGAAGDDTLVIGGVDIPRHLHIDMGSGDNQVILGVQEVFTVPTAFFKPVSVGGNFHLKGGDGADALWFWDLDVSGNFHFNAGHGDNFLQSSPGFFGDVSVLGKNAIVNTGNGNDSILIDSVNVSNNLLVHSSGGENFALATSINVGNNAILGSSGSSNILVVEDAHIGNNLLLEGGDGINELVVFADVGNNVIINSGYGAGTIAVVLSDVGNNLILNSGGGNYFVAIEETTVSQITNVNLGSGFTTLVMAESHAGKGLNIFGSGSKDVTLVNVTADCFIIICTGSGSDTVTLVGVETWSGFINTGGGDDIVSITDSVFHLLQVSLGSGDDWLGLKEVTVTGLAVLFGGSGDDVFEDLGDNNINWCFKLGF